MKRVLTAVVLIPLVLALLFKAPNWLYSGVIGLIAVLAAHEYFRIANCYQEGLQWYVVEVAIGLYFLGHCLHGLELFGSPTFADNLEGLTYDLTSYRVLPLVLLLSGLAFKDLRQALPAGAISYLAFPYIAVTLGEISLVGHSENGRILVFVFLLVVWSGDIFAFYAGRAFGKHKLAESISPKKTWEGATASCCGAIVVSILLFRHLPSIGDVLVRWGSLHSRSVLYRDAPVYPVALWLAAAFGLCVNIAAQLGDLVESALKRGAGVKDSGNLLPGHGGILDRIDAVLLAAPVLWFFHPVLYRAMIRKP